MLGRMGWIDACWLKVFGHWTAAAGQLRCHWSLLMIHHFAMKEFEPPSLSGLDESLLAHPQIPSSYSRPCLDTLIWYQ